MTSCSQRSHRLIQTNVCIKFVSTLHNLRYYDSHVIIGYFDQFFLVCIYISYKFIANFNYNIGDFEVKIYRVAHNNWHLNSESYSCFSKDRSFNIVKLFFYLLYDVITFWIYQTFTHSSLAVLRFVHFFWIVFRCCFWERVLRKSL